MALPSAYYAQLAYDKLADAYDHLWTPHVAGPNSRLTLELDLRAGIRVADLACGTGLYTVEMAKLVTPGEVVGVDYSEGMLAAARERADGEGVQVALVHAKAEDFVSQAEARSFDAVSLRFALAYLDWNEVLPRIARLLRPGGRVGVLTSLATSVPQFSELYQRFRKSPEPAWKLFQHTRRSFGETWKIFRHLRETFGEPRFITVPATTEELARRLEQGGLRRKAAWTESVRLWFASGSEAVTWMVESGYATHHALEQLGPVTRDFVESLFASGLEGYREAKGIPLDLVMGGVVGERPCSPSS